MKVEMTVCDNEGCSNLGEKLNHIVITTNKGLTKEIDLCDECLNKFLSSISFDRNNKEIVDVSKKQPDKTNSKTSVQTVNVEQPKRKKGSYGTNTKKLIEDYGIERLKHEYIDNNRYSAELAAEIGVSKTTLDMHLRKLGITKRKKHKDENKEASEKEDN